MPVSDISDEELLRRAVDAARSYRFNRSTRHLRWVAVMDTFSLGSAYAHQLCARFGLDPDEFVK